MSNTSKDTSKSKSEPKKRKTEAQLKTALKGKYGGMAGGTPVAPRSEVRQALGGNDRTIKRAVDSLTAEGFFILGAKNRLVVSGKGLLEFRTPSSIEDFLEFRLLIEPVVAEVAAAAFKLGPGTCDTPAKARFETAFYALPDPLVKKGVAADLLADRAFHGAMHALSTNPMLAFVLKCIDHFFDENITNVVSRLYSVGSYRIDTYQQHKVMAEAILAGKAQQARRATHDHLSYAHEVIRKQLRSAGR